MINPRILFMGTPDFACSVLQGLIDNGYNIVGVLSQPDRPVGRKHVIEPTPTKSIALLHNIPVYQFDKLKENVDFINEVKPELIITCAYGQIIPDSILKYPKYGCINVHGSLLPNLRGGAPIHHAIIDGYSKTGISIMEMISKMDAGKVYATKETEITDDDNLESLTNRLKIIGRDLLLDCLQNYLSGKLEGVEQDESLVTFGWNIKKEEENIDFNKDVRDVFNLIRGLSPSPAAHTFLNGKIFKIYKTKINEETSTNKPGSISLLQNKMIVFCKTGSLQLLEVQIEGKQKVEIKQFLNGNHEILKEFNNER